MSEWPRRHSNSSKTFKKNRKKIEINLHDHFRTSWIILNNEPSRPNPTRPGLTMTLYWLPISRKLLNIGPWNLDTILIQVFSLCFWKISFRYRKAISFIVWKLRAFWQRSNFSNFAIHLFFRTFDGKGNFKFWRFHQKNLTKTYLFQLYFNF